ncbi:hypothetical protein INR49_021808, partial [Caranx melampygus]
MKHFLPLCVLGSLLHAVTQCTVPASEFQLDGDYLIGGLFDIHYVSGRVHKDRPESIDCTSKPLILSSYRRFQLMRFSVEEINNSTDLLPNISLGYEIFDHCLDVQNFPAVLNLISVNDLIKPWGAPYQNSSSVSKVVAVVGPFSSSETLTVAAFFMMDLIPMVTYGAASSAFSEKIKYPSFLRTVHSNKDVIEVLVNIVQHFNWRWVAFLNSDDEFGKDGRDQFIKRIKNTKICLAYAKGLNDHSNHSQIFKSIEAQKIN